MSRADQPEGFVVSPEKAAVREQAIRDFIERHLVDDTGLLLCHLHTETLKPWTTQQLRDRGWTLGFYNSERGDAEGQLAYEDSLMATGEYAHSQILRYRATGEPDALAAAAYQISAILRVLDEGGRFERGFLPKPHGGMRRAAYSHEISVDQYIKCIAALVAWRCFAAASLARRIDRALVDMADYHLCRDFTHPRRECMIVTPENRTHGIALFIPMLHLAHQITGDERYRRALPRFDPILDGLLNDEVPVNCNILNLFVEGFHLALRAGCKDERLARLIGKFWDARLAESEQRGWDYDDPSEPFTTSRVIRIAASAPIVDAWLPDRNAAGIAWWLLDRIHDPRQMRYADGDPSTLPVTARYRTESLCETSLTSWLLAYWRLRENEKSEP
jgi:hypothetical protein